MQSKILQSITLVTLQKDLTPHQLNPLITTYDPFINIAKPTWNKKDLNKYVDKKHSIAAQLDKDPTKDEN